MSIADFFNYWTIVGPAKIVRIFWFYFLFEFTRFLILEFIVLILALLKRHLNRPNYKDAMRRLEAEEPFISIIVPGKNEGKHIYKLVKSLNEQTYKNYELIVVDDGSDDNTEAICKSLLKNGMIDIFHRNHVRGGKASAANTALRFAKGKFIVHLDADCSYDRDAIKNIIMPFYFEDNVGAVGGNVMVRNYNESLATMLQAIEYQNVISAGRTVSSYLGIYRVISGAFGAFRADVLEQFKGWDIGPGLDGDITVKIRKLGYKVRFEPNAVCQTSAPNTFRKLIKQRKRWDKSLIRFRVRKHINVFFPTQLFRWSNFFASLENITYNLIFNMLWFYYFFDVMFNMTSNIGFIVPMNILLYTVHNLVKFLVFYLLRERKHAPMHTFLPYVPLMVFYYGFLLRFVRSYAYLQEFFFKKSYDDPWNPPKSSKMAKELGI